MYKDIDVEHLGAITLSAVHSLHFLRIHALTTDSADSGRRLGRREAVPDMDQKSTIAGQ
jgi:hypothetical protein